MLKLHPAHFAFLVILISGLLYPDQISNSLSLATRWFETSFGWLVLLVSTFFVGFCGYIAFGKFGKLRLGGDDERPQFSTLSWLAMLFAAGMGTGLVFYGAAEPLMHFSSPPPSMSSITDSAEQARRAMALSYFHWGIHAWAIYGVAALSVAYFAFHRKAGILPSVPLTSHKLGAGIIDGFATLAVVFGVVASLCQGVLHVSSGIANYISPMEQSLTLQLVILAALFICYMLSASTGIGRGIKQLSDINIVLAVLFMLFILFAGPTHFIIESFVSGVGDYLDQFISLSFNVRPFSDAGGWTEGWTINYLLWWVAWGPFVGVFVARISRGRTLKEFMLGVILAPSVFSAFWFATLGGASLHLEMFTQPGFAEVVAQPQSTTYALMQHLPFSEIMSVVVVILLFIFLVTSADSGTYVLGMFTSGGTLRPPVEQRLFWGVVMGVVTIGALLTGKGTEFFRAIAVVGGIPYLFIMIWQSIRLWKAMEEDSEKLESERGKGE